MRRLRWGRFRGWGLGVAVGLLALAGPSAAVRGSDAGIRPAGPPNVVLILADDLGWADLGCYGADLHETPNLDRLARDGLRFTEAYAPSPVCSPSRASLLTGKHPARLGLTIWSEGALSPPQDRRLLPAPSEAHLAFGERTLATHLKTAGYVTVLVGKWHLGDADRAPEVFGFDVNIGGTRWGAPATYWWPYRGPFGSEGEFRYVPDLGFGREGEYLTDRLTDEALKAIDRVEGRPFFLYLAHHGPHTPIEAKPAGVAHFDGRLRPEMRHQNPAYAAMVKSLDESVGRVVAHLDRRGLTDRTILVFASDNGGFIGRDRRSDRGLAVTSNAPLRSGKGSCYEGGLRVPLLVRWPGVTPAGGVCPEPVVLTDLFPTLLGAAGVALPDDAPCDGVDLRPVLGNPKARLDRAALFFHYPHYYETTTPVSALRAREWKLVEYAEDGHAELYRLTDDPVESRDLAQSEPGTVAELRTKLGAWKQSVGAREARPNPGYGARP